MDIDNPVPVIGNHLCRNLHKKAGQNNKVRMIPVNFCEERRIELFS